MFMKKVHLLPWFLTGSLLVLLLSSACNRTEPVQVNLKSNTAVEKPAATRTEQPLRIGMGAMITPKDGYVYYQQLQKYIEKKLGQPVQLVDRENYDEMNSLLETGNVDAAFICAGPYVEGKKKFGMELLAMPLVKGKPLYFSYIIVHKDSSIKNLQGLRGKTFAFADPKSNSGKLVPTYMLARMNETPESYFSRFEFTYGHDKSIRAVAEKLVDGAAVDSLIWEYAARRTPELTAQTRIIARSEPYGIPPIVVRPGIDPELKKRLRDVLISAADEPEGREILAGMMIERFVAGDDKNYDSIRSMNNWVAAQRNKGK
jgi:phosphonate transport system substrate-binding protein